jgi:hypothetical protein
MNGFHFRRGGSIMLPALYTQHTILFTILTCAQRTRVHFLPEELASVSFGFVLVRVRVYSNRNLCLISRIGLTGFMRVKINISLRKRTLSPVRLVLEIRLYYPIAKKYQESSLV